MTDRGVGESRLRTLAENGERVPFDVPKPVTELLAAIDLGSELLTEAAMRRPRARKPSRVESRWKLRHA